MDVQVKNERVKVQESMKILAYKEAPHTHTSKK